ncbi:hypothetical protein AWB69_00561 [Caballeronia udeis]|uniref:Methyltransferase domain-containing protein n=1 Tax=Caballeronia udeis TaxID=1232866 RepID=A0A158F2U8_9BURK|nr:class I SAM-dependent methyltransferase [Caballeronia udeis]SAL13973.1 hypothetical protein AWB69_00561 [Caballeronia udeis]
MITDTTDGLLSRVLRDLLSSAIVPAHLEAMRGWHEDSSFALWIVENLKPGTYVQLGLGDGDLYISFCQAVQRWTPASSCYGVEGAPADNVGMRNESGHSEFARYHDQYFRSFSRLVDSTFDKALASFPAKSVDLLHLHGQYEAERVQRELEPWLSKLSDRAVVLVHTTHAVGQPNTCWQWATGLRESPLESSGQPLSFDCGHGLTMLSIGRDVPDEVRQLTRLNGEDAELLRRAFEASGLLIRSQLSRASLQSEAKESEGALVPEAGQLESLREQLWKAEIERRRLEVESCRYEVHLAERVAISRHTSAEKDRLITGLQNENQAIANELAELRRELAELRLEHADLRQAHDLVLGSRSMAITKPMRVLIDIARRVRR